MTPDQNNVAHIQAEVDVPPKDSEDSSSSDSDSDLESGEDTYMTHEEKMEEWASQVDEDSWEEKLLEKIVNTDSIPPNYQEIFVDPSIIKKLEHITTLSRKRPKAFSHGILQKHRITGAIIYGPPGSGKTLLCRSLAKQSGFNMLAISPAEIWQRYRGETEQAVKGIFSLARIIHPCILFIDEADSLFSSRRSTETHARRSMIDLFLMEWDGMMTDLTSPLVLLATNRPSDLDRAVLRRAPYQIRLDEPGSKERAGILSVLLREESLGPDIEISKLVKLTSEFTGSGLKNLCVAAALECVKEQEKDSRTRMLMERHFLAALETIGAINMNKAKTARFLRA